jgi:hypothetical protein
MRKPLINLLILALLASCGTSGSEHVCDGSTPNTVQIDSSDYTITNGNQTDPGEIIGTISSEYGEPLPFARIKLTGSQVYGAISDIDGKFKINPIPPGTYNMEISSMGYETKVIEGIIVKSNQFVRINRSITILENQIELLKPIIYIYPEETMDVNVQLDYNGELTTTYPKYNSGWNVSAQPDGTLHDASGRSYYALYWEGNPKEILKIKNGTVVSKEATIGYLEKSLATLGLNEREANEFIMFWLPYLEENSYNLIHFAGSDYTENAELIITPEPETIIRVMMVFKGLDQPINIPAQDLSKLHKTRKGFTVVEWGGQAVIMPLTAAR